MSIKMRSSFLPKSLASSERLQALAAACIPVAIYFGASRAIASVRDRFQKVGNKSQKPTRKKEKKKKNCH